MSGKSQFVYNKQTSSWKVLLYDIDALVCSHKTHSLVKPRSFVARSFCENKLVRKYRPSALSMKKSIFNQLFSNGKIAIHLNSV